MKLLQIIKLSLLIMVTSVSSILHAQYVGGIESGATVNLLNQVNCNSITYPDIFKGGTEDGHSMVELTQINCSPVTLPNIFNGGSDDGHAMAEVIQINCSPTILPDIFNGGNDDGHAMAEVIQINCAPAVLPDIYVGGIEDGHAMETIFVACAPNARFEADTLVICEGETLQFNDLSSGPPTSWSWTFNGGTPSSSTDQNPTVVYDTPGNYSVTLSITSDGGNSSITKTNYITVNPAPTPTIAATGSTTICDGDSVLLSSLNTYDRYQWSNGDTTQNSYTLVGGENTLTVTSSNGCTGISNPITVTIEHNPQPEILVGDTSNLCMGDVITLTSTIQSNYLWSPGGETTQSIDVTSSGTFWVTSSELNGCSRTSESITLNFGNSPSKPFITTSGPVSFCDGDSVLLTSQSADQYLWSPTSNTTQSVWVKTSGMYRVEVTNPAGCSAVSDAIEITVNPKPIANASINTPSVCVGDDVLISTTNELDVSYLWNGPNGYSSSNRTNNLNAVGTSNAGWYIVSATLNGCTVKDSVELEVNETPIAVANAQNTTICEGEDIALTANTVTADSYSWTGPNGFTSNAQNPIITEADVNASGIYTLEVAAGVCSTTSTVTITVNPTPIADANAVNATICVGEDIALTAATIVGDYAWTGPNGFTSSVQNPTITEADINAGGIYTLEVTAGVCSTISTVTITVNPTPIAEVLITSSTLCSGDNITFNATGNAGATYTWTGPNGFTNSDQNPEVMNVNTVNSGWYIVTVSLNSCTSKDSVELTVEPALTVDIDVANTTVCEGEDILLSTTSLADDYLWTGPNGFTSINQNATRIEAETNASGYYILEITSGSCSNKDSVEVTINATPVLSISGSDITCYGDEDGQAAIVANGNAPFFYSWSSAGETSTGINGLSAGTYTVVVEDVNECVDSASIVINEPAELIANTTVTETQCNVDDGIATVNATGGNGNYSYLWMPSGQTTSTAIGLGVGSYTVLVTDAKGCDVVETVVVNSVDGPVLTISNISDVSCFEGSDGSASVSATGGSQPYTYNWSPSGGTSSTANNLIAGDYVVTVTDNSGCASVENVVISEPDKINVISSIEAADCGETNGSISLNVTGGTPSYSYNWLPNGEASSSLQNISGGDYQVIVSDDNGCSFDTVFVVPSVGEINVQVLPQEGVINKGESIVLSVNVDPSISNETYNWTPSTGLSCTQCPNPIASPIVNTQYTVEVTTPDNCSGSGSSNIIVIDECAEIYIPDMFSPNDDGENDEYCIYGDCISTFYLQIFNRWGEMVYVSDNPENCWDGTFRGKKLNTDVFAFKLSITTLQGEKIEESGNINLFR